MARNILVESPFNSAILIIELIESVAAFLLRILVALSSLASSSFIMMADSFILWPCSVMTPIVRDLSKPDLIVCPLNVRMSVLSPSDIIDDFKVMAKLSTPPSILAHNAENILLSSSATKLFLIIYSLQSERVYFDIISDLLFL